MPNVDKIGVWPNTDLDLNTSGSLKEASIAQGMSPDSLAPETRAGLERGYEAIAMPTDADEVNKGNLYLTPDQGHALIRAQERCDSMNDQEGES
jgi:hypothetical protein